MIIHDITIKQLIISITEMGILCQALKKVKDGWMDVSGAKGSDRMYNSGKGPKGKGMTSLISDRSRVYKGGGWNDRMYWMSPGARRYLDERKARENIGFRCAMTRVGSPGGF